HKKYEFKYQGSNMRIDELQAAILRIKLPHLDKDNEVRRQISRYYRKHITNPNIILPSNSHADEASHVWHLFVVRTPNRARLQQYLLEKGIQTLVHYPIPPHKQEAYAEWNDRSYPISEIIHNEVLSLPISPVMKDNEV